MVVVWFSFLVCPLYFAYYSRSHWKMGSCDHHSSYLSDVYLSKETDNAWEFCITSLKIPWSSKTECSKQDQKINWWTWYIWSVTHHRFLPERIYNGNMHAFCSWLVLLQQGNPVTEYIYVIYLYLCEFQCILAPNASGCGCTEGFTSPKTQMHFVTSQCILVQPGACLLKWSLWFLLCLWCTWMHLDDVLQNVFRCTRIHTDASKCNWWKIHLGCEVVWCPKCISFNWNPNAFQCTRMHLGPECIWGVTYYVYVLIRGGKIANGEGVILLM